MILPFGSHPHFVCASDAKKSAVGCVIIVFLFLLVSDADMGQQLFS